MIKKGLINGIINIHGIKSIEQHLVYFYVSTTKLDYSNSPILSTYFNKFEQNSQLAVAISSFKISNIKELENHLELIIPNKDKKLNGAFFTPDYIIDFIIKELSPKENDKNVDPSCGCGAFLIGLTDYYKKTFKKSVRKIVQENIFGSDILDYNICRTKLILAIYALQNGEILLEQDFNLYHQDSLKTDWKLSFDNVVGNPPYVKFQDLSDESRYNLEKDWTTIEGGTFNLYFAFFELGYMLLKPSGKLGYITPNNYFTSLAGKSIRKYFHQKKCISRIINFSHKKVFDAQTYTAITFLNKQENDTITYDRIKEGYTPEDFLPIANGSLNYLIDLNYKKWRLLKTDEQNNIRQIEAAGTPIGHLFNICAGIATLKDDIFFVDGTIKQNGCYIKNIDNKIYEIEKKITKPIYKISDFKSQEDVKKNTRRIIFPYKIKKGIATPINEIEFEKIYPKCYAYLLSEKENLLARNKGKLSFEPFYVWGRTQGLTRKGTKILSPTFSQQPRFLLAEHADAYYTNGYGIYFKEQEINDSAIETNPLTKIENIEVLLKILNSCIMQYYISKTSVAIEGGYSCYQINFLENFTIPLLTYSDIKILHSFDNKEEIDAFLIAKYQLNLPIYIV